jgi:hypothetical protein
VRFPVTENDSGVLFKLAPPSRRSADARARASKSLMPHFEAKSTLATKSTLAKSTLALKLASIGADDSTISVY